MTHKRSLSVAAGIALLIGVPAAVACWVPTPPPCKGKQCPPATTTGSTTTAATTISTTATQTAPTPPVTAPTTTSVTTVPPTAPEPPAATTPAEPTPAVLPPKPVKRYTCRTLPKGAGPVTRRKFCGKPNVNKTFTCPGGKPFKVVVRGRRVCLATNPNPRPVAVAGERR